MIVLKHITLQSGTYRFPCGRWLGKGVDDGALERLLIAELVPPTTDTAGMNAQQPSKYLLFSSYIVSVN